MKYRLKLLFVASWPFFGLLHVLSLADRKLLAGDLEKPSSEEIKRVIDRLEAMRNSEQLRLTQELFSGVGKCGLRLSLDALRVWQYFTPQQRADVARLLDPLPMQKDTVIGRFRIHYDTSGVNEPALLDINGQRIPGSAVGYVDSTGQFFNDVRTCEIDSLGYTATPLQVGELFYDIYIINLGIYFYGRTVPYPNQPINPGQTPARYTTYIEVHNDFQFFFSQGMKGLKVTAAHEFHHALQLGSYGYWPNDIYFYEITSTWMEDVVYNDINDYYQYIKTSSGSPKGHFAKPDITFTFSCILCPEGEIPYSRAIWGKYVEKRFSRDVMRRTWEYMRQFASLQAISMALGETNFSLPEALAEFSLWNYFTSGRANIVSYYTEGSSYPLIRERSGYDFQSPASGFIDGLGVEGLGSTYHLVYLNPMRTDSMIAIISNIDTVYSGITRSRSFEYVIRSELDAGDVGSYANLENGYFVRINGIQDPSFNWVGVHASGVGAIRILKQDSLFASLNSSADFVYPNPFIIPEHRYMRFRFPGSIPGEASLNLFSSSLQLVFSKSELSRPVFGNYVLQWDGRNENGEFVSSGIYLYVLQAGDQQFTGKLTLIRK